MQSTICTQNKKSDNLYIVKYICNGLEELCISVVGICCAGCFGYTGFSRVLQNVGICFFIIYYDVIQLNLKDVKTSKSERENLTKSLTY